MSKVRTDRQRAIEQIVRSQPVRTQAELVDALAQRGFRVAQATVSRDIASLDLRKGAEGTYVLAQDKRLQQIILAAVADACATMNQVVVHTQPGSAPSVAAAVDAGDIDGVLGSIAGDDTVLVVCADAPCAFRFAEGVGKLLASR